MPAPPESDLQQAEWLRANQAELLAHLASVKQRLARYAHRSDAALITPGPVTPADTVDVRQADRPLALAQLVTAFNLSPFERNTLLLCVGMELDSEMPSLCAAAQAAQFGETHDDMG